MLSYYTFVRKTLKWWEKRFFHLFDLAVVNAQILHKKSTKKKSLEIFSKKVAEGLLTSAGTEIQALGLTSSPAGHLVGTGHFLYRIPATHAKREEKNPALVQKEASTCPGKLSKFATMYCRKCDGLCVGQCFEVHHLKLNYWE
jgi:hypothetical protein